MSYKSITSFVCGPTPDTGTLECAAYLAQHSGAHLSVCALGIDRVMMTGHYIGATAVALQQTFEEARSEAEAGKVAAKAFMRQFDVSHDVDALPVYVGSTPQVVADRAQFADLVVLPKPYGPGKGHDDVAVLEAALFGTRVPILVVPQNGRKNTKFRKVMIAWNEGAEALAAIRAAAEFLEQAESVDICIVDPPTHGADRSDPGGRIAQMLSRHGVRANISVLAKTLPKVSEVLCRHAKDTDADLLVMGAYGHSRLREAILGGATRDMLDVSDIPILMAH